MNKVTAYSTETTGEVAHRSRATLGLALALFIPSVAVLQRYLSVAGLLAYLLGASVILVLFVKPGGIMARMAAHLSQRDALGLAVVTFAVILFILLRFHARTSVGNSSANAPVHVAAINLLQGRFPNTLQTDVAGASTPLPGAVLLALPFAWLDGVAYQNLFWLIVFFVAMSRYLRDWRSSLLLSWVILVLSPAVGHALLTGQDAFANALFVLLCAFWLVGIAARPGTGIRKAILPAILLGIGLSSRTEFLLLLPLIFAALAHCTSSRLAMKLMLVAGAAGLAATLPLYLYAAPGLTPLETGSSGPRSLRAEQVIVGASAVFSMTLAWYRPAWPRHTSPESIERGPGDVPAIFLRNTALVLAPPAVFEIFLYTAGGYIVSGFAVFGIYVLFSGAAPAWREISRIMPPARDAQLSGGVDHGSDSFYRVARFLGSPFAYRCVGTENITGAGAAIFIANHLGSTGPIECILSLPLRLYPWVIANMTDPQRAPAYIYDDFVRPELHLSGWMGKLMAALLGRIAAALLTGLGAISVDGARHWTAPAFRQSLELLGRGRNLLIFPEDAKGPLEIDTQMHPFLYSFVWLCHAHQRKTGDRMPVYPVAVVSTSKTVEIGAPLYFALDETTGVRTSYQQFCDQMEDAVRSLYLARQRGEIHGPN